MFCGSATPFNCIEPDFTLSGATEWNRRLSDQERAEVLFASSPEVFRKVDQQNGSDPKWPLANYWPIYLSNFMVNLWEEQFWYDQVSNYFAYHGLQTRMIYFHTLDTEHLAVQKHCWLIDALVYFSTTHEAKRAISKCNRRLYYGHRLNVLPGRTPLHFFNDRSVRLVRDHPTAVEKSETSLENELTPFGLVEFITRQNSNSFLVEFDTSDSMLKALVSQNTWKPIQLSGQVQKQRFVEADVKDGICWAIESQDGFLERKPRPEVNQYFEDGIQPIVETRWKAYQLPRPSPEKQNRKLHLKLLWKQKKKEVNFWQMTKREKNQLFRDLCNEAGYSWKPPKENAKKLQNDVLKSVNWFLRTRDKSEMTKKTMAENLKLRNTVLNVITLANEKGILKLK